MPDPTKHHIRVNDLPAAHWPPLAGAERGYTSIQKRVSGRVVGSRSVLRVRARARVPATIAAYAVHAILYAVLHPYPFFSPSFVRWAACWPVAWQPNTGVREHLCVQSRVAGQSTTSVAQLRLQTPPYCASKTF